ncbi:Predicted metal-binding protein [Desulfonauticus submarinus]|uniref:Predicted metal-binding protein n=1 Tax=Desulfonauticus submarinus TaxID=206665 RepID=A0A1H0CIH6_9BACT|nr:CGGC domain-containing protein [Desulfonauticus submarinus]SDN57697.1 Predicted metal-binding protein [Desulfonauticus submarinus]
MEKILILGCKMAMNDVCIGCSRCLVAFNRREGEFARYGKDAEIVGLLNCGGCPGSVIVTRLVQLKLWNMPLKEQITKIHIAFCMNNCPYKDELVKKIQAKAGIEVVMGTHPYKPENIFSS